MRTTFTIGQSPFHPLRSFMSYATGDEVVRTKGTDITASQEAVLKLIEASAPKSQVRG